MNLLAHSTSELSPDTLSLVLEELRAVRRENKDLKDLMLKLQKGIEQNITYSSNSITNSSKELAKQTLLEILIPDKAKKLSKNEQFQLDIQNKIARDKLALIHKETQKQSKANFPPK